MSEQSNPPASEVAPFLSLEDLLIMVENGEIEPQEGREHLDYCLKHCEESRIKLSVKSKLTECLHVEKTSTRQGATTRSAARPFKESK